MGKSYRVLPRIEAQNGLPRLEVTDVKWWYFVAYYDDRAVQVLTDTGHLVAGGPTGAAATEMEEE